MKKYDVVIIGSGIVGVTHALALAKQTQLQIGILEANPVSFSWDKEKYDKRVSAISFAAKKIFQNLNVWHAIVQKRVSPYKHMHVWDAGGAGEIHFDCDSVNENELGFIIEDNVMRASLLEKLREYPQVEFIFPEKLKSIVSHEDHIELTTENNLLLSTRLLIGADGANSRVRELANFEMKTWDYNHTAIVATLQTEYSHQHTAWQRFLMTGPLAFLPLTDEKTCSIVWSAQPEKAQELLALNDEEFRESLANAFEYRLGQIETVSERLHFPLRMRHAKNYVKSRIALIGDAAHTIHPLAGQGVNLGLLDAVCLAEVIVEAVKKSRDFAALHTLRRYERGRKSDNLAMLAGVEMLKHLFASENVSIRGARTFGLQIMDRTKLFKNFFANYALGKRKDLPVIVK